MDSADVGGTVALERLRHLPNGVVEHLSSLEPQAQQALLDKLVVPTTISFRALGESDRDAIMVRRAQKLLCISICVYHVYSIVGGLAGT